MKIDLKQELKTLTGKSYEAEKGVPLTLGAVLAEALATDTQSNKVKLYLLAQKAYSDKEMEVDQVDFSLIKNAVENCKSYNNNSIILGQTLSMLDSVK